MAERTLLWVDLTLQRTDDLAINCFEEFFTVRRNTLDGIARDYPVDTSSGRPDALCFDYDYPDRQGLMLLEQTKRRHPSIPILMLTLQHSEKLAIWAFRSRVWDYFAKPVSQHDAQRCHQSLSQINLKGNPRQSFRVMPPIPAITRVSRSGNTPNVLQPAIAHVQANFADKISLAEVAELCGMSTFRFSRQFHSTFGLTFQEFLTQMRITKAEELLMSPSVSVGDVAYAVGYRDVSYFGRVFRKQNKMSPTQWRHHQLSEDRPQLHVAADCPVEPGYRDTTGAGWSSNHLHRPKDSW